MKNYCSGFKGILGMMAIAFLVLAIGGFFFYPEIQKFGSTKQEIADADKKVSELKQKRRENTNLSTSDVNNIPTPSVGSIDVSNWKTYRNEKYGFEVKYPVGKVIEGLGNVQVGPLYIKFIVPQEPCLSAREYAHKDYFAADTEIKDIGSVVIKDKNVDAWQISTPNGKGGTAGGEVVLAKKICKTDEPQFVAEILDSRFIERSDAERAQYFESISTFKFIK